jgi:DNA-directed RNA polymerase subunit M/transcription elongation factor TFIIS
MKLEKLQHPVDDVKLVNKINEIIDLLNNSFLTQDPDTVYGSVTASLSTDRLTPLSNETICESTVDHLLNMVEGAKGIYDNIKCPKCGAKYFEVGPSVSTCVYYAPIIKDGFNINPDRNKSVTTYTCYECGHRWKE